MHTKKTLTNNTNNSLSLSMAIFTFLLLQLFFFLVTTSASTEADILLTFKASIEDPSNSLSSWSNLTSTHYCNWTGITCSSTTFTAIASINLQSLNLSGEISSSICELTNLTDLNLSDNLFNQPLPLHLSLCTSLQSLNLSENLIWGTVLDQIDNFGFLEILDLSKNHIEGKIPESIGSLKNLRVLSLGSNLLSGTLPLVFGNFSELVVLDLSQNGYLVSEIPADIGKLSKVEQVLLQSSGFYGRIPDSFSGLKSLTVLDLSQNNLSGFVPLALASSLKNLVSFDVSENKLVGSFPDGICGNAKELASLSLHTNFFNGSIPTTSVDECLNLERFQVQNNGFSGDFPDGLWSLAEIKVIRAENNRFSGQIPNSISKAYKLEQVQIDNNSFTGQIPQGLGIIKTLYRFSASLNGLSGELPLNFCDSPVLSIINISHNSLSGQIPQLNKCHKLVSLSLASNTLDGPIPSSLADLPVLTYLDLSNNSLSGPIPEGLRYLKLALFNVSYNKLSGEVPSALISGLPASSLQGNPELCGSGLPNPCKQSRKPHRALNALASAFISILFGIAILLIAAAFFVFRRSSKQGQLSVFFYPLRISEQDLLIKMSEKSIASSGGAFGQVYTITLPSNERVCVKKIVSSRNLSSKSLKTEIKTLAKIRHKNIVKVLGFCYSDESIVLIYEYLEKGSLGDLIGRSDFQLPWSTRMRIALGVAQGLAYLHQDYVPHLCHRNIKSKNILLDGNFEPKITGFGLERIIGEAAFRSIIASESTYSCSIAPEFKYSMKPTEQMDVYSFGVVLLELITGRQANNNPEQVDTTDIVTWVRRKINLRDGAIQVLDKNIAATHQEEMLSVLDLAIRCTAILPEKRPLMSNVVRALQSLVFNTMNTFLFR